MIDDPETRTRLAACGMALRKACGRVVGATHWGDGYFIYEHPLATREMSFEAVEALHRRPASMTVDKLTLEECDYYYFRHEGYITERTPGIRHAFRYFMPRYVDVIRDGTTPDDGFPLVDSENFGRTLARAEWWSMKPDIAHATDAWLAAWLAAAARYMQGVAECRDGLLMSYRPSGVRNMHDVATAVVHAGVTPEALLREMRSLGLRDSINAVAALIEPSRSGGYRLRINDPSDRREWPAMTERMVPSFAALEMWAAGRELAEMLEQAVYTGQWPEQASIALSYVERFVPSSAGA